MNSKRIIKILLTVIGIIMVATILYFLFRQFVKSPFVEENVIEELLDKNKKETDSGLETAESGQGGPVRSSVFYTWVLPYDGNTKKLKEEFVMESTIVDMLNQGWKVQFCVNSVEFTKENVDSDAPYSAKQDENNPIQFDENDNILNDYTYVKANVTLKNLGQSEVTFYMNSFRYVAIDPSTEDIFSSYYAGELRGYKTQEDLRDMDKSYAEIKIPVDEMYTCNLVFIQQDSDIEGKEKYLLLEPAGAQEDESKRYVRLEE